MTIAVAWYLLLATHLARYLQCNGTRVQTGILGNCDKSPVATLRRAFCLAIAMAKAGNIAALRLCLEPLLPTRKNEPLFCEIATLGHESQVISLLFPCYSLFRILPFRRMSLLVLAFLQILAVPPPPLQDLQGKRGWCAARHRSSRCV